MRLVLAKHGLNRISLPPVKPIKRFVAQEPNELWQVDIMGKVRFPLVGDLYLILALDDHSRFILLERSFLDSLNSMSFWFFIGRLVSGEFRKGFFPIGGVSLRLPIAMGRLIISGMPRS